MNDISNFSSVAHVITSMKLYTNKYNFLRKGMH